MEDLYKELLKRCEENSYTDEEMEAIQKAYEFACKCHKGQ